MPQKMDWVRGVRVLAIFHACTQYIYNLQVAVFDYRFQNLFKSLTDHHCEVVSPEFDVSTVLNLFEPVVH